MIVARALARGLHTSVRAQRFKAGLVGLPNVGKSSVFNALVGGDSPQAQVANYPFCTIDAQHGVVTVEDARLARLAATSRSQRTIPAVFELVDIAGLIQGASKGDGLGNQFLANIRECAVLLHVVRCFEDANVSHVSGGVDPLRDMDVINFELVLADQQTLEKAVSRRLRARLTAAEAETLDASLAALAAGRGVRAAFGSTVPEVLRQFQLLTAKPVIYVLNVADTDLTGPSPAVQAIGASVRAAGDDFVLVSAQLDAELAAMDDANRASFLVDLKLAPEQLGRHALSALAYRRLQYQTFFTSGPAETKAWTIHIGTKAPQAAGKIHSDLELGFICAEIMTVEEFVAAQGRGRGRQEGRDYVMKDGDVVNFKFNKPSR